MKNNNAKKFLKYCYCACVAIGLFYLILIVVFVYMGPISTLLIEHKLKRKPIDIVVSLTTTPYRIATIKPVLDSIFRQSIKPGRVYVNVPWLFKRENKEYIIPNWLKNYPNIIINRTNDYGPATKLIATLLKESDPNTVIITIDDDRIYPKHMVRDLIRKQIIYNYSAVITGSALNLIYVPNFHLYPNIVGLNNQLGLVVQGFNGVAYVRKFFNNDVFSFWDNIPLSCWLSDDLMISAYLHGNNIEIYKTTDGSYNEVIAKLLERVLPTAYSLDALLMGANKVGLGGNLKNYGHCFASLPSYNKSKHQEILIERSGAIIHSFQINLFKNVVLQSYYYGLQWLIDTIPFMKLIIIKTLD